MTAEQVIASIGIAAGLTGLVWLAVECISLERIERPAPDFAGDPEPPPAILLTTSTMTDAEVAEIEAMWAARHAEYVPEVSHFGTPFSTGVKQDHVGR
jgi:hypothetical protein